MPNIRKQARTQQVIGPAEMVHFAKGFCLVAGGCSICSDTGQNARYRWIPNVGHARKVWQEHRLAILAQWYAHCEERGETGACGVPLFAEALFDNALFPPLDKSWPAEVQRRHETIRKNLALHAAWAKTYGRFAG